MSKISVIIPAYNAQDTIERALLSVIRQEGAFDFQIIVIDDGSSDSTAEKITKFAQEHNINIDLIRQANTGVATARNNGIRRSCGQYIAFLDADDEWRNEKTQKQMTFLTNSDYFVVGGGYQNRFISADDRGDHIHVTYQMQLMKQYFQPSTVIMRKEVFNVIDGFAEGRRYSEDALFFYYVTHQFKSAVLRDNIISYADDKHPYASGAGLGAKLWKMETGELSNYTELMDKKLITVPKYFFLVAFSLLKFFRRLFISRIYKLRMKNGDRNEK
ncbi:glycosyltransferase family A protein [Enterobacter sp.]|uniref:glycosyltransferase family 2 protein n=1 Tax=Enterobacter sp. TaxID=42895 RepID=UPI00296FAB77|nr:glycosyltransferase family A protein [Enterobacter sp.]